MTDPKRTPREIALLTLERVLTRLAEPTPLWRADDDLERKQLGVAVEHAMEAVRQIEETKRPRRKTAAQEDTR